MTFDSHRCLLCDSGGSGGSDGGSGGSGGGESGACRPVRSASGPLETKMFGIHREIAILAPQNANFFRPAGASQRCELGLQTRENRPIAEFLQPAKRLHRCSGSKKSVIYAHKNQGLHKRDKLREQLRHGLQEQCCGSCFAPRAGPRCSGVLWALLAPTARSV